MAVNKALPVRKHVGLRREAFGPVWVEVRVQAVEVDWDVDPSAWPLGVAPDTSRRSSLLKDLLS